MLAFDALTVEGALISPAMLTRIAARQAGEQAEADYGVPKGLTLRDEIARYFRIGQALFAALTAAENPSAGATIKFVETLLRDVLGFTDLERIGSPHARRPAVCGHTGGAWRPRANRGRSSRR